jgi:hypothetical protein
MVIADGSGQLTYDALRQFRHEQAKCSMLIQHTSPAELALEMARKHGQIVSAHVFCRDADRGETKVHLNSFATYVIMYSGAQIFRLLIDVKFSSVLCYGNCRREVQLFHSCGF